MCARHVAHVRAFFHLRSRLEPKLPRGPPHSAAAMAAKRLAAPGAPRSETTSAAASRDAANSQDAALSQGPRDGPDMPRPNLTGAARYQQVGSPVGTGSFGRVWIALDKAPLSVVAHRISR